ncbi:MAG TPA: fasciclin domain-containing protein [Phycisphaerales bacterium]|nr:fasciclin domain-containing protein [Phycisphaerales bacterium]
MNRSTSIVGGLVALAALAGQAWGQCSTQQACETTKEQPAQARLASYTVAADDVVSVAAGAGKFTTLLAAAEAAGLVDALRSSGPITVFAPTDEAFARLPAGTVESLLRPENRAALAGILTYHVVPGAIPASRVARMSGATTLNGQRIEFTRGMDGVRVDGAAVIAADIEASNGIIHVIDRVILPADGTIVAIASKAGTFATLLAAAKAAGLADALAGEGPFTVLAPTDEAFAKLPAGTVESLLEPENKDKLASILKYHVIPGRVYAAQALALGAAATLQGNEVVFDLADGALVVDGARVVRTDIDAYNGVIHVIDAVILPQ